VTLAIAPTTLARPTYRADDMMAEFEAFALFDDWVKTSVTYVQTKGIVPGVAAQRRAQSTAQ
jgi:hypothetical protein